MGLLVSTVRRVAALLARGVLAVAMLLVLLIALFFVLDWIYAGHLPTPRQWGMAWAALCRLLVYPDAPAGMAFYLRVLGVAPAAGALATAVVLTVCRLDRRHPALARRLTMWGAVAASLYALHVWALFSTARNFIAVSGRAVTIAAGAILSSSLARRVLLGPRRRERLADGPTG